MEPIKKSIYCLDNIPACCKNPKVTWGPQPGVLISCPPGGKCLELSFIEPVNPTDKKCIWVFIECGECGVDRILEKKICFCSTDANCGPCENCGPEGVCIHRCPDGVCDVTTDTCGECGPDKPCTGGKVCIGGKCQCPPGKPFEINGRCTECAGQADCEAKYGKCYVCSPDGGCVYKGDCGGGGVCDPRTGNCEECVTESDCLKKGDNFCCSEGKKCVCCPGFVLNPLTGKCDRKPDCTGIPGECGPCGVCKEGRCVPRQCPDGQICIVDTDGKPICAEKCDCNNPASCSNEGKVCKNINGICACVSCGVNCASGCTTGCHCENGNRCVVDKCNGSCKDGGGCGGGSGSNNCGCLGKVCVDCGKLNCATGECDKALGCECDAQKNCVHTGKKCVGGCDTTGECGSGCTCNQERKKCEPCEFFDCPSGDCAKQEGCRCGGSGVCEGDPDYKCPDTLTIEKDDPTCDILFKLKKDRECSCPLISTLLSSAMVSSTPGSGQTSGTHKVKYKAGLYFGNHVNDPNWLINNTANPEIGTNETANGGSLRLDIITNFQQVGGIAPAPLTATLIGTISGKGEVEMGEASLYQMNGLPISSGDPLENRIVASVTFSLRAEGWEFPNTCKYPNKEIGTFEVISNTGYGSVRIQNGITTTGTRDPKFVMYKSDKGVFDLSTWIKTVYVPLDPSGEHIHRLHDEVLNGVKLVESCFDYGLKTDCSCKPLVSKKIVFCKPPDFTADIIADSCGRHLVVNIGQTCHANKNKDYELLVNGVLESTFKLWGVGYKLDKTYTDPVTSVVFRMKCKAGFECVVTKNFTPPVPPNVEPDAACILDGTKVKYTFHLSKYSQPILSVAVKKRGGGAVESDPTLSDDQTLVYILDPFTEGNNGLYDFVATFQCGEKKGELKKNCCELYKPKIGGSCAAGRFWVNLYDTVTYYVGSIGQWKISKADLAKMNIDKPFTFTPLNSSGPITLQPENNKVVNWSPKNCTGGSVYAEFCLDFTFEPEQEDNTTMLNIPENNIYPPTGTGETYELKVNGGAFASYTPGNSFQGKVGVNTMELRKGNVSEVRTLEIRSLSTCDITSENIIIGQDGPKYTVEVPNVPCPCTEEMPTPFSLKKVTKTGDFFKVEFYDLFGELPALQGWREVGPNERPFIKSGKVTIVAPGFAKSIDVADVNKIEGFVEIPCKEKNTETYNISYTLERTNNGTANDKVALLRMCLVWPSSIGTSIASIRLINLTNSQEVEGITQTSVCYTFGQVDLTGAANLNFIITLSDGSSFILSALDVLNPSGDDVPFVYGDAPDESICNNCLGYVGIAFSGELVNGCIYNTPAVIEYQPQVCDGDTEIVLYNNSSPRSTATPNGNPRIDYYLDSALIKRQFVKYPEKGVLGDTEVVEYGHSYSADIRCICSIEKNFACVAPIISAATLTCISGSYYSDGSSAQRLTYSVTSAYPNQAIYLYKNDGTLIDSTTSGSAGQVTDRAVVLSEAIADLDQDLFVYAYFDANCKSVNKFAKRAELIPTWTRDCTNSPVSYDLIFASGITPIVISGTGTVVANTIINIPNNTAITFTAVSGDCTSKEYTETHDCTVEPTPSISVSKTRSVPFSATVTPSVTKSISVSRSKGSNIELYSKTPSKTRSVTPSITPSISLSPSNGYTPSVSRSISITKSTTPSISISPSNGTSSSVTPSLSISVSISKTPSVSISASAGCDSNCANFPAYDGDLCGGALALGSTCCHGVSYNPLLEQCCSGVVTQIASDESNCGGCGNVCTGTCINGVCHVSLSSGSLGAIADHPCRTADASGYCISTASAAVLIPDDATEIAIYNYSLSYAGGGEAGGTVGVDVTSGASILSTNDIGTQIRVVVQAVFDSFRVKVGASENNIIVLTYKRGATNYKGTFTGGGSVLVEWGNNGSPTCGSACDWLG